MSLRLLRAIFSAQYFLLVFGMWPHRGHACQKHPSTKTASPAREKKKSGTPKICLSCIVQPLKPVATSVARSLTSVVLLPVERIARMFLLRATLTLFFIINLPA
jgi:hypothetical protein